MYCACYSVLFRGTVFLRTRCICIIFPVIVEPCGVDLASVLWSASLADKW